MLYALPLLPQLDRALVALVLGLAQHFVFAVSDPLVDDEVGDLLVLPPVFEALDHDLVDEDGPVGYSFDELVAFSEVLLLLEDGLPRLLQDVRVVVRC